MGFIPSGGLANGESTVKTCLRSTGSLTMLNVFLTQAIDSTYGLGDQMHYMRGPWCSSDVMSNALPKQMGLARKNKKRVLSGRTEADKRTEQ